MNDQLRIWCEKATPIQVNTQYIEKNKPFRIVKRSDYKTKEGVVVGVYIITLPDLDPRWMSKDPPPFQLFHLVGTSDVISKVPGFDFAFLFDQEAEEEGKKASGLNDQGDLDAINIVRNQVLANTDRQSEFIRLRFPEILNNDVFSGSASEGKILPKLHLVERTMKGKDGKDYASVRINLEWKIAVHEDQKRQTSIKKAGNELADQAAKLLGGISFN